MKHLLLLLFILYCCTLATKPISSTEQSIGPHIKCGIVTLIESTYRAPQTFNVQFSEPFEGNGSLSVVHGIVEMEMDPSSSGQLDYELTVSGLTNSDVGFRPVFRKGTVVRKITENYMVFQTSQVPFFATSSLMHVVAGSA